MSEGVLTLPRALSAWNSPAFHQTLIEEIEGLGPDHPALQPLLQNGLTQTSAVANAPIAVHLLSQREQDGRILAHLGVFYAGIIAGCSCADDPTPPDSLTEHCELQLEITITSAKARLLPWEPSPFSELT
ncbi:hypothetical protein [Halochromatium sp.]